MSTRKLRAWSLLGLVALAGGISCADDKSSPGQAPSSGDAGAPAGGSGAPSTPNGGASAGETTPDNGGESSTASGDGTGAAAGEPSIVDSNSGGAGAAGGTSAADGGEGGAADESADVAWDLVAEQAVDNQGGVIHAGALTLTVPAGAVRTPLPIQVYRATAREMGDPKHEALLSDVYRLEPSGWVFDKEVEVAIEGAEDQAGTIIWSAPAEPDGYLAFPHQPGTPLLARANHFSAVTYLRNEGWLVADAIASGILHASRWFFLPIGTAALTGAKYAQALVCVTLGWGKLEKPACHAICVTDGASVNRGVCSCGDAVLCQGACHPASCAFGQTFVESVCSCQCPDGTKLCGNACHSSTCPVTGQVFDDQACACVCPSGTHPFCGQCVGALPDSYTCCNNTQICSSQEHCVPDSNKVLSCKPL